jgi:hypothetical protein
MVYVALCFHSKTRSKGEPFLLQEECAMLTMQALSQYMLQQSPPELKEHIVPTWRESSLILPGKSNWD